MEKNELTWKARWTHSSRIPAPALMIVGSIVTTTSLIINYTTATYRFSLFAVIGITMFIYGVVETFSHTPKPKPHQVAPGNHKHNVGIQHGHRAVSQHAKRLVSGQRASQYQFCPYCGTRIAPHASFCSGCGQRLPA